MKKIVLLMICVLAAVVGFAQSHSFRDTTYVRYEQFDYDAWVMDDPEHNGKVFNIRPTYPQLNTAFGYDDILQYNYTDNPDGMEVVGLSATIALSQSGLYTDSPTEYLLLYEASTDSFVERARVPWHEADTVGWTLASYITNPKGQCSGTASGIDSSTFSGNNPFRKYFKVFDYYFDKPIVMYDSFYVGGTDYSAMSLYTHEPLPESNSNYVTFRDAYDYWDYSTNTIDTSCSFFPTLWKIYPYGSTIGGRLTLFQWNWVPSNQFLMVLPIIRVVDTSFANAPECPRASGVFVRGSYTDTVTMQWDYDSLHTEFEVSYGREGTPPDAGTIVTVYDNRWQFTDTAYSDTPMVSYVRTVCREYDTLRWSGWSGSVRWRLHHDADTNHTDIDVPEDQGDLSRHVRLMPNPAGGNVLVMSSYGMERVEVYDARGGKVYGQAASGTTAGFDVSKWPKGAYVVLVRTAAGTAAKRLVVQ